MIRFTILRNARWLTSAGLIGLGADGYPSNLAASEFCGRVVAELLRECPGCEWRIDQRSESSSPVIASGDVDDQTAAIVERAITTAREAPCMTRITLGKFLSTRQNAATTVRGSGEPIVFRMHELHGSELLRLVGAIDVYGTWHWLREERLPFPWNGNLHEITAETPSHFLRGRPLWCTLGRVQINDKTFTLAESIDWPDGEIMEVVERGVWRCKPDGTRIAFTAFLEAPCQPL